ncbi:MAG: CinA family protein [Bdellovibrionaceae bacterium]|nr:CinA family protein [Pseudobdellovibrionaceae bacterium]
MDTLNTKLDLLINNLRRAQALISFAESCTGGKLSAKLAEKPGVSDIYVGSVVSYANSAKEDILGVLRETIQKFGAVSEQVALEMAKGAVMCLRSTWSLSITGVAGPSGGTSAKPVGTVCFAVVGPNFELTTTKLFSGSRIEIQEQAVSFAVDLINKQF